MTWTIFPDEKDTEGKTTQKVQVWKAYREWFTISLYEHTDAPELPCGYGKCRTIYSP